MEKPEDEDDAAAVCAEFRALSSQARRMTRICGRPIAGALDPCSQLGEELDLLPSTRRVPGTRMLTDFREH